jgi:hypothetical protein
VKIEIFVEGGGNLPVTRARCREAFAAYCKKISSQRRSPSVVPCGGRADAFSSFLSALKQNDRNTTFALLVDSEGPVSAATAAEHLARSDQWSFPKLGHHRVFLMVQAMEAWFLADRAALERFYGAGFRRNSLPGSEGYVEAIRKEDLEPSLKRASTETSKGEYHKTRHGFALLALIDPSKIENSSPNAAALHQFLREQLL